MLAACYRAVCGDSDVLLQLIDWPLLYGDHFRRGAATTASKSTPGQEAEQDSKESVDTTAAAAAEQSSPALSPAAAHVQVANESNSATGTVKQEPEDGVDASTASRRQQQHAVTTGT
eukprot:COSAG06_NODE_7654_length_2427_cov_3.046392_4_plen_116_part_01